MYRNNLKYIFRNLLRHRTFSLINIFGLAIGIAACLVIYFYVSYEKSYDSFNKNADNIYRLKNVRYYTSGTDSSAGCVAIMGPTLKEELPEVNDFSRIKRRSGVVTVNNTMFSEKDIFWADSSFLTMFSFPLIEGNSEAALVNRNSAVITKSTAQKYFGRMNAVGETFELSGTEFKITGILEDVPANSHIHFNILLSFDTQLTDDYCWPCNNNNTYIQVVPGTKQTAIQAKLPLIVNKLHNSDEDGFKRAYFLQPLRDIHLYSNLRFEHEENGNAITVYFISLIAVIILLIAWINYINLSTALSMERAKEVGLRKTIGAGYATLMRQFLMESFVINLIAIILALIIVKMTYPLWMVITGLPSSLSIWGTPGLSWLIVFLVFINPLVAGLYPAFVLTSYKPVIVLRGSFMNSARGLLLRKGLVIFQFTITIVLLAAITVFNRQLSFMMDTSLGFDTEQKLVINAPPIYNKDTGSNLYDSFFNELYTHQLINKATFSTLIPGMENNDVSGGVRQENQSHTQGKQVYFVNIAPNFLDFFKINMLSGRNFSGSEIEGLYSRRDASKALIINASACQAFGISSPEKAIGTLIYHDKNAIGRVIGVIDDYHQQSLDKEVKPMVFEGANSGYYFIFDVNVQNISSKIADIKKRFTVHFPDKPFEYLFLDEFFDQQYNKDIRTAEILAVFTFLSVFISCLGLVGLSSIMTIQRTKEIGIRKVLGASVSGLVQLLSKDFIKLVVLANIIAWPLAWYLMNQWLLNFAYRIDMHWWMLALAGLTALGIALITISGQALRAATANPVESLRYE